MIKIFFLIFFLFIFIINHNAFANEKKLIIENLIKTKTLKFNFEQITNKKKETGECLLYFDKKFKCTYGENKKKELVINDSRLAIVQKRYNKIYYYPIKKSILLKILDKDQLIKLINFSKIEKDDQQIRLTYINNDEKEIVILFDKASYNLKGWIINDQFDNIIIFKINNLLKNEKINLSEFVIPKLTRPQN
mgnify:CR=1 FL=1